MLIFVTYVIFVILLAGLAHLVEQRYRKPQVVGSSPTAGSRLRQGFRLRQDYIGQVVWLTPLEDSVKFE
jgi:hypothetical protein